MYDIEFYENKNGESEVYEYIQKLRFSSLKENKQKLKKIYLYFDLLAEYGLNLKEPYVKKITKEIWELRPLSDRILFASWHNNKFIILCVFTKKTQKTPKREIERAEKVLKDYKERCDKNE